MVEEVKATDVVVPEQGREVIPLATPATRREDPPAWKRRADNLESWLKGEIIPGLAPKKQVDEIEQTVKETRSWLNDVKKTAGEAKDLATALGARVNELADETGKKFAGMQTAIDAKATAADLEIVKGKLLNVAVVAGGAVIATGILIYGLLVR